MTLPQRRNPLAFPRAAEPAYPAFHPLNPDTYDHGFNLIAEIAEHKYDYQAVQGDPWLTIYNFPSYLKSSIDRVRAHATKTGEYKPSAAVVIACCIQRGITQFGEFNDINGLIAAKEKFDKREVVSRFAEEFYSWWQTFKIGTPDSVRSGSSRINVALPANVKATLRDLSDELSVSDSSLATLAVMHVMAECPVALNADSMSDAVNEFLERVTIRKEMADWWFSRVTSAETPSGGR